MPYSTELSDDVARRLGRVAAILIELARRAEAAEVNHAPDDTAEGEKQEAELT